MFTTHGSTQDFPRSNLKRLHEDDPLDMANGTTLSFTEHRHKRFHALPLRTSPIARRWSPPANFFQPLPAPECPQVRSQNVTPSDSDSEEAANRNGQQNFGQQWGTGEISAQQPSYPSVTEAVDMDMDMAMDTMEPECQRPEDGNSDYLEPGAFQPDQVASSIGARMPTPIQPSFAAQVRGNNWSGAAGNLTQVGPTGYGSHSLPVHGRATLSQDVSVPRTVDHGAMSDWSCVQNRSLPSPISESGGEEVASPGMVLDGGFQVRSSSADITRSMLPRSQSTHSLPPHPYAQHPGEDDTVGTVNNLSPLSKSSSATTMDTDPPATPSPKKGHSRSRHTLNSWTIQPGMKKSFSIGYRADCEKCRAKVPGHFNHIIVS